MIIIIYSETDEQSVADRLGEAEYSYYFVLKEFRPVLERLGRVVQVKDPHNEVDPIFHEAARRKEACIFLSFSPPHRTPVGLACPTIPVIAWEVETIPSQTWYGEPEQDWRGVLNRLGRAITHSADTAGAVRADMGPDFPIASIPAPVWDRFAPFYCKDLVRTSNAGTTLCVAGKVVSTRGRQPLHRRLLHPAGAAEIGLDGVIYLSILNPHDGRKNMFDMIGAFCEAFREVDDATLILKLSHHDCSDPIHRLKKHLDKLRPFKCQVLFLAGYLEAEMYERLVRAASFAVNSSHGEGQCLPLMELMSCGKPAVAPQHTGMADYIDDDNAFVVQSSAEPTNWPQDPRCASRTLRQRIDFEALVGAYRQSYGVAKTEPERYARMAANAHEALRRHCSRAVVEERLTAFLAHPSRPASDQPEFGRIMPRVDGPWAVENVADLRVLIYGPELDFMALSLALLGAKVDVVTRSRRYSRAVRLLAERFRVDLAPHLGGFGVNASDSAGGYDLILFCDSVRHRKGLRSTGEQFRSMMAPGGKVVVTGEPIRRRRERPSLWRIGSEFDYRLVEPLRKWVGPSMGDDDISRLFESLGFASRRYSSPLNSRSVPILELSA